MKDEDIETEIEEATPVNTATTTAVEAPNGKRKRAADDESRHLKRVALSFIKPSYALGLGSILVRPENRGRLQRLLSKLMITHNWKEASGAAALLLEATKKETCPDFNRFKYSAVMEVYRHARRDKIDDAAIGEIYDIWMTRVGVSFKKKRRLESTIENSLAVRLESIVYRLLHGHIDEERDNARSLLQEHGFENNSTLNLIVGMIFYQLWYSTIPSHIQLESLSENIHCESPEPNESCDAIVGDENEHKFVENSASVNENEPKQCASESSVAIGKSMDTKLRCLHNEEEVVSESKVKVEPAENHKAQIFYTFSTESENPSESNAEESGPDISAFGALEQWILPIRTRNWDSESVILNDEYAFAVKCLSEALHSKREMGALLPLIQLLLIGGDYKAALSELESCDTKSALVTKLKASILEVVASQDKRAISSSYKDALKCDPTCIKSLTKLIELNKEGVYSSEELIESIAVHLEAATPQSNVWREFASCFLKVLHSEEDRMSTCLPGGHYMSAQYKRVPKLFLQGSAWKLRWRWWARRHFSAASLASDTVACDCELMVYKAACASHMYGAEYDYVVGVHDFLTKEAFIIELKIRRLILFGMPYWETERNASS